MTVLDQKEFKYSQLLTPTRLDEILEKISTISTVVMGDGILDIYWEANMTLSELSRETPHFPLPVVNERIHPGGGANVAANMAALGVKDVFMVTVIGNDWRGREFKRILEGKGINLNYVIETDRIITPAYCKPLRQGISDVIYEDPRLDFENREQLDQDIEGKVIEKVKDIVGKVDAAAVADQLDYGVITDKVRGKISSLGQQHLIVVDSRNNVDKYKNVIVKPNQIETMNAVVSGGYSEQNNFEDWRQAACALEKITRAPVLMTMGSKGAVWIEDTNIKVIPALSVTKPLDSVGAGDCFMANFVTSRAAGAKPVEAVAIANLAAAVTVKKINITGTATRTEIRQKYKEVTQD